MIIMQRHISPDNFLEILVEDEEGDISIGFKGFSWHVHGDMLASQYNITQNIAIESFIKQIISDKLTICVLKKEDSIIDVWVSENPSAESTRDGEILEFRHWSG